MTSTLSFNTARGAALGAAVFAISAVALAFGYDPGASSEYLRDYLVTLGIVAVATAVVYAGLLPRRAGDARRAGTAATVCAGLAVLTFPVFWLGLPLVFGSAAVVLGRAAGSARGKIAMAVGGLLLLAAGAALVAGV